MEKELVLFIEHLRQADASNDDQFRDLFGRGVDLLTLGDLEVARQFDVSRPTATRWRNGDNAPHPAMRKLIYGKLERRAQMALRRERARVAAQQPARAAASYPATDVQYARGARSSR